MHEQLERFREAYLLMARMACYRPRAPGDGCGHVLLSAEQLADRERLEREATLYARDFIREEDTRKFHIGCSDFRTNRAFAWVIEAARQLASGDEGNATALALLRMAIQEVEEPEMTLQCEAE